MKKRLLALLPALLLCFGLAGAPAWADNTILVNLGTTEAGAYGEYKVYINVTKTPEPPPEEPEETD